MERNIFPIAQHISWICHALFQFKFVDDGFCAIQNVFSYIYTSVCMSEIVDMCAEQYIVHAHNLIHICIWIAFLWSFVWEDLKMPSNTVNEFLYMYNKARRKHNTIKRNQVFYSFFAINFNEAIVSALFFVIFQQHARLFLLFMVLLYIIVWEFAPAQIHDSS